MMKSGYRIIVISAGAGFVFSALIHAFHFSGFGPLLLKGLIGALLWGGGIFGISILLKQLLPEIYEALSGRGTPESDEYSQPEDELDDVPQHKGTRLDVTLDDEEPLPDDDSGGSPLPDSGGPPLEDPASQDPGSGNENADFSDLESRFGDATGDDYTPPSGGETSYSAAPPPPSAAPPRQQTRYGTGSVSDQLVDKITEQDPKVIAKAVKSVMNK